MARRMVSSFRSGRSLPRIGGGRRAIEAALANCAGNQTRAAEQLGSPGGPSPTRSSSSKFPRPALLTLSLHSVQMQAAGCT